MKKVWVVKAGGELVGSDSARARIVRDLARWQKKISIVFVHGGGSQIEQELNRNQVKHKFVNGRRVTSEAAIIIVERVLSGEINKALVGNLCAARVKAVGLSCRDAGLITAKSIPNLGRTGTPDKVNVAVLKTLHKDGFLPVVSTVASDSHGRALNVNADDAASAIARALKADNLVFLTDIAGVWDKNKKPIATLRIRDVDRLIDAQVIKGGMIPKVQGAAAAVRAGVGQVNIVDGFQGINLAKGTAITH